GSATDRRATSSAPRPRTCSGEPASRSAEAVSLPAFIEARRSIRAFRPQPVDRALLDRMVEAAWSAPAAHHSRPWRWVVVDTPQGKRALADGMGERWRQDLEGDGVAPVRV